LWGGRLASQRDVAFGSNFPGVSSEYNRIPNLFNEGGCRDNHFVRQKTSCVHRDIRHGNPRILSCSEGEIPCGQLESSVRVRHTVSVLNGKPGIPIRHSALLGRFGYTCLGSISPALRLAPVPQSGDVGYHGNTHFSAPLGWLRVGGRKISSLRVGTNPRQTQNLPTSLEILRGSLSRLRQCSRGSVQPPKGQDRNKSLSSTPEGIMHIGTTVLKGCGCSIEPPIMTFEVIIFECFYFAPLSWTSRDPSDFGPGFCSSTYQKFGHKKECIGSQRHPTGRTILFRRQLFSCRLLMVGQPDWIVRWFSNRGTRCDNGYAKSTSQSPVVIVFVD